ncbi:MAG: TIGR00282 family metallophosphoesterase [Chitinivibrionales bacterium]
MKILFIGDVFGNVGRRVLAEQLRRMREEFAIDICIANGENIAGGKGITYALFKKMHKYGVDVVTGGNHSMANKDALQAYNSDSTLLRPLNMPPGNPGIGKTLFELSDGRTLGVINLQGRTFFKETLDCPFRTGERAVEELSEATKVIFVDFHAEATSEKLALATYLDGRVSAVVGTHTHVQTADERILAKGTAYITDAGMTGPEDSIIGMKPKQVIQKFLLQTHTRFEPSQKGPMFNGVIVDVDEEQGNARSISRLYSRVTFQ